MNNFSLYDTVKQGKVYNFAIIIFISILVLHGTYFRIRPSIEAPTMDWLVLARLLVCSIGLVTGTILIRKGVKWGFGASIILLYVFATGISAINSQYPKIVIGYSILLLGASVLMIGLVYRAKNTVQLEKIEKIWFITVSLLVIKDTFISLLFPGMQTDSEVFRLGMGVTHANTLSFYSTLLFWISFRQKRINFPIVLWVLRVFLVYIIIGAISRVSIAAFLMGGFFFFLFKYRDYFRYWIIVISVLGFVTTFFFLSLSLGQGWSNDIVTYLKRNQDSADISTFTGRYVIWKHIQDKVLESPFFGHGYGTSRLTIGELRYTDFIPDHSHNELLEVIYSTGIFGLIPFIIMLLYSLKWIIKSLQLSRLFSTDLSLHAVCVVTIFFVSSIFEARLGGKLLPTQPLLFFYLLTLDRGKYLLANY